MQENKPRDLNGNVIEKVKDVRGNIIYIDKIIGQGGQGMVCRSLDKNLAIKFLTKDNKVVSNQKYYDSFKTKVDDVSIIKFDDDIHLCRPEVMLEKPMCGYVMLLLNGLQAVSELVYDPNVDNISFKEFYAETGGLKKRLEVLIELSRTIARLHSNGVVYCDISPNNAFYAKGDVFSNVWLIDCDNLKFTYEVRKGIFTPGYGAPEVVNQISSNTIFSDCYSFAVLAFRLLTGKNPFEENYSDSSTDGWDASTNKSDEYLSKISNKWIAEEDESIKEKFLKHFMSKDLFDLFNFTFNDSGVKFPSSRPSMLKWYEELKRSYVRITKCACGQYVMAFEEVCPFCNNKINRSSLLSLFTANLEIQSAIDNMKESFNKNNPNEDFYINEEEIKQLKAKIHFEKEYDVVLYNGFTIYNFNFNNISIDEMPSSIFIFTEANDVLYITKKIDGNFFYKTNKNPTLKTLPENVRVQKGEKMLIILSDKETKEILKYLLEAYE